MQNKTRCTPKKHYITETEEGNTKSRSSKTDNVQIDIEKNSEDAMLLDPNENQDQTDGAIQQENTGLSFRYIFQHIINTYTQTAND